MTERQKKLLPYVEAKITDILVSKEAEKKYPALATEPEILSGIREDVIECMRELHRTKVYQATGTINNEAMKRFD